MNRKRASIVDELIASEKEYVEDLTLAVDMYLKVSSICRLA
jgi:predicted DNA-binding protein